MEELRIIKRLYTAKKIKIYSLITSGLLIGLLVLVLKVNNDFYPDKELYIPTVIVFSILILINIAFVVSSFFYENRIYKSLEYKESVDKIIGYYCHLDAKDMYESSDDMFVDNEGNIKSINEVKLAFMSNPGNILQALGVRKPVSHIIVMILSCVLLVCSDVPHFIDIYNKKLERDHYAIIQLEKIEDAFVEFGEGNYYIPNPKEEYSKWGYYAQGYLNDGDYNTYIGVHVDVKGIVDSLDYNVAIDKSLGKEENIEMINQRLKKMHDILLQADVEMYDERLYQKPELPEEFINEFMENGYDKGISIIDDFDFEDKLSMQYYYFTNEDDSLSDYGYISIDYWWWNDEY